MGVVLTVACCLWDVNEHSRHFSRGYNESWADKLFAGFKRNLSDPFRFVVFTDRDRQFAPGIEQERLAMTNPHYGACIEPFKLDEPMIFVGLDTVIVGNCDRLADYALTGDVPLVPKDPFYPASPWPRTNAVVVAPKGCRSQLWEGYTDQNDMTWINACETELLDEAFPGAVVSYKGRVQHCGLERGNSIVYFHGSVKPHELPHVGWVHRHWHAPEGVSA